MADDIPEIADTPKAALESFIRELETYYYTWYDKAATRNYYTWFVPQALSLWICHSRSRGTAPRRPVQVLEYWSHHPRAGAISRLTGLDILGAVPNRQVGSTS